MQAIQYTKNIPRYLLTRALAPYWNEIGSSPVSLIQLVDTAPPALPGAEWVRVRPLLSGICGSDLSTIQAKGSPAFSPFVSCPFVLGHEVVGIVTEVGAAVTEVGVGDRVVIEPALHCRVRGIQPLCQPCQRGRYGNCEHITQGTLAAGMQTGFCRTTGGGWSASLVAHQLQIHKVPATLANRAAVLTEPLSCAIHAVLKAMPLEENQTVLVMGCGTIGLLTIAALRGLGFAGRVVAIAKYSHQAELAEQLGATLGFPADNYLYNRLTEAFQMQRFQPELGKPVLLGGVDCTFDCVASATTLDDALRFTRAGGKIVLVGMPVAARDIDWSLLWFKELQLVGAYTYGMELYQGQQISTFELAFRVLEAQQDILQRLVTGEYPLQDYRTALRVALDPGNSKSIKTVLFPEVPE